MGTAGRVSRGVLHAEMQDLRREMQTLRADVIGAIWRVALTGFGLQVVLIGVLLAILIEVLARSVG